MGVSKRADRRHTIFCPPGPEPFKNDSVNSSSLRKAGRSGIFLTHLEVEAAMPLFAIAVICPSSIANMLLLEQQYIPRIIVHIVERRHCTRSTVVLIPRRGCSARAD